VNAQEERVGALVEIANRLLEAGHYSNETQTVMEKKDKIEKAREMLKEKRAEMEENILFQEFKTEFVTEKKSGKVGRHE